MWFFYLVAVLMLGIGAFLWHRYRSVSSQEFLLGGVLSFALAGLFHLIAYLSVATDTETLSGRIFEVIHSPSWVERYTYVETYSTGSGKYRQTHTRIRTAYRTHPENWRIQDTIPNSFYVTEEVYRGYVQKFSNNGSKPEVRLGSRPGFHSGDRNDYFCVCPLTLIEPTTDYQFFENRIRSGPSTFGFEKIDPKDKTLPEYPNNGNHLVSDRLVGEAAHHINIRDWDQLNAILGPKKHVNLILVGFNNQPSMQAHRLRSKWFGGKKNDLVLCYGYVDGKVTWAEVFSWSKSELCKQNLRTILLENNIEESILPKIRHEVETNYVARDWNDFSYIQIEPPFWCYLVFMLVVVCGMVAYYYWAINNDHDKPFGSVR